MQDYISLIAIGVLAVGFVILLISVLKIAFKVRSLEFLVFLATGDKLEKEDEHNDSSDRHRVCK